LVVLPRAGAPSLPRNVPRVAVAPRSCPAGALPGSLITGCPVTHGLLWSAAVAARMGQTTSDLS